MKRAVALIVAITVTKIGYEKLEWYMVASERIPDNGYDYNYFMDIVGYFAGL